MIFVVSMKPFMEIPHKMGFWVQIPEGLEFLDGPENLRRYYAARGAENPQSDHWATGVAVCDKWIALLGSHEVRQFDIDSLLGQMQRGSGSAWSFMRLQFKEWAEAKGFKSNDERTC